MSGCSSARTTGTARRQRAIGTIRAFVMRGSLSPVEPASQSSLNAQGRHAIARPHMATMITSECINCGACEPECPNTAIYQGGVEWQAPDGSMHAPISNDIFYIVPEKCTECVGFYDQEACAKVCPVDCCVPDPERPESEAALLERARALHPDKTIPDDSPSRFKKEGAAAPATNGHDLAAVAPSAAPAPAAPAPAAPAPAGAPAKAAAPPAPKPVAGVRGPVEKPGA